MYRGFLSSFILFPFQGMFCGIIKALILGSLLCLFVGSFVFSCVFVIEVWPLPFFLSSFLSFLFFLHCCPREPEGLLFTFCCLSHRSKCRAFFWQALEQGNEKWLTHFSSSSFSLALLLSDTCKRSHTHTHTSGRPHALKLHRLFTDD